MASAVTRPCTGRSRRAVSEKLNKQLRDVQQGVALPDERQTVAQFLEGWLEHKRARLRPRAWLTSEQAVRLHLLPGLGKIPIARLTVGQVEALFSTHQPRQARERLVRWKCFPRCTEQGPQVWSGRAVRRRSWRNRRVIGRERFSRSRRNRREHCSTPQKTAARSDRVRGHRTRPATRRGDGTAMGRH